MIFGVLAKQRDLDILKLSFPAAIVKFLHVSSSSSVSNTIFVNRVILPQNELSASPDVKYVSA